MRFNRTLLVGILFTVASSGLGQEETGGRYDGPIMDVHMHAMGNPSKVSNIKSLADFGPLKDEARVVLASNLAEMDRNKIQISLISGLNEVAVEAARRHETRFKAGFLPMLPRAFRNDRRVLAFKDGVEDGTYAFLGEFTPAYHGISVGDASLYRWYAACEELDVPVFVHCGYGGPAPPKRFKLSNADPSHLVPVLDKHPELKVVICHLAWPFVNETVAILREDKYRDRVWVDTGAVCWDNSHDELGKLLATLMAASGGSKQILFGSDSMERPERITTGIENLSKAIYRATADTRVTEDASSIMANIFYRNAAHLLKIDADAFESTDCQNGWFNR